MTSIFYLEQTQSDLPKQNEWLSAPEMLRFESMRFPKRRDDWRLGRWTAKRALASYLGMTSQPLRELSEIEIRPSTSGAPEAYVADRSANISISISHSAENALCAVSHSGVALGCDLEVIEPRSEAFLADFFTDEERTLLSRTPPSDRSQLVALLWSGKESTLKAMRVGLRLDTRSVTVTPTYAAFTGDWLPLQGRFRTQQTFHGWWQSTQGIVRTVIATPSPSRPLPLVARERFCA